MLWRSVARSERMAEESRDAKLEAILDEVGEWGVEFSESPYFEALTDEQKRESEFIVMKFAEYMYTYFDLAPAEWDERQVEECCVEVMPRKVTAEESFFRAVAPVLVVFFDFLDDRGFLEQGVALAETVQELEEEIIKQAQDPANWGMAKSWMMQAKEGGVDMNDPEEIEAYFSQINPDFTLLGPPDDEE